MLIPQVSATPTENVVSHPRISKSDEGGRVAYYYYMNNDFHIIYSKIIVTYLSTQYSIAIHTKVKESIILRYRTQLSIYLQQLQFLSHVSCTLYKGFYLYHRMPCTVDKTVLYHSMDPLHQSSVCIYLQI